MKSSKGVILILIFMAFGCQKKFEVGNCYIPKKYEDFWNGGIFRAIIKSHFKKNERVFVITSRSSTNTSALFFSLEDRRRVLTYNFKNYNLDTISKSSQDFVNSIDINQYKKMVEASNNDHYTSSNIVGFHCMVYRGDKELYSGNKVLENIVDSLADKNELTKLYKILNNCEASKSHCHLNSYLDKFAGGISHLIVRKIRINKLPLSSTKNE